LKANSNIVSVFRGSKPFKRDVSLSTAAVVPAEAPPRASAAPGAASRFPVNFAVRSSTPAPALVVKSQQPNSQIHRVAFYFALIFVFSRFSLIHETLSYLVGIDLHLVTLIGAPTMVLMVISGAIPRTLRSRPALFWVGFALWLVLAVPFSSWRGGS